MKQKPTFVGLGELLWDVFPEGKHMGGAPANFAYMATVLGAEGVVASRVGTDSLGDEALARLRESGLKTECVQRDEQHSTGTVQVSVDGEGQPEYAITESVAWDFLEWNESWADLATKADAICFGSLAQRCSKSRETIRRFLDGANASSLRIFDVNLRHAYYSREVLEESLRRCEVLKVNQVELPIIAEMIQLDDAPEQELARRLRDQYGLRLVCVTRGNRGSLLIGGRESAQHEAIAVKVVDTVGAGDAFTACMAYELLRESSLEEIGTRANRFAAWVASEAGGMPRVDAGQDRSP